MAFTRNIDKPHVQHPYIHLSCLGKPTNKKIQTISPMFFMDVRFGYGFLVQFEPKARNLKKMITSYQP
ncbi:hypothetical protein DERP_002726 [Dermatophagoides pteronyssinus]|uniref:Uncharacterized protein n=1 Tax=Dermatophagoides pteronyssinus TaxID=6956 RepID=A0ABQ8JWK4_DERPT|nr:hypothetical protein DERP_002726 [Dermatophagoides pteronyssinus]